MTVSSWLREASRLGALALVAAVAGCTCEPGQIATDASVDVSSEDAWACAAPAEPSPGGEGRAPIPVPLGRAIAGRARAGDLPGFPSGLGTWATGDFVLANERIAVVIEDVGPSDLYDPWGGRPVGFARIEAGRLVDVADFGEFFILEGRHTVLTESVSVVSDGRDGGAAIVRAIGWLRPLPFFEAITARLLSTDLRSVRAAIDYVLEPGADHIDVFFVNTNPTPRTISTAISLHGFMYGPRMPGFTPGHGFGGMEPGPFLGWVDDGGVSTAYAIPGGAPIAMALSVSGFTGAVSGGIGIPACATTRRHHARITLGDGRGLDALLRVQRREVGAAQRPLRGRVVDGSGEPVLGARVVALSETGAVVTRSLRTPADGTYEITVPDAEAVDLRAYRVGQPIAAPVRVGPSDAAPTLVVATEASLEVRAEDLDGTAIPARVQVFAVAPAETPRVPDTWGERDAPAGRVRVDYLPPGGGRLALAVGTYRVVVSRGYEYELSEAVVTLRAGEPASLVAVLERSVATPGVQCGDFHLHTIRSNDSGDPAREKILAAAAEGLELPVRSDHEYVEDFQPVVDELGLSDFVRGFASVELSSMETWGHMGVFPLEPDVRQPNGGAPLWQEFPTESDVERPLRTMEPPEVFALVRARRERPVLIINHPLGSTNYFGYAGYDPVTGMLARPDAWDEDFSLVEVFNDADWARERGRTVPYWLSLLDRGRRVFAVGSSDSHSVAGSPVGYPRTCIALDLDSPRGLSPSLVRDRLAAGAATVSGGIYVDVSVGEAGPGAVAVVGMEAPVRVRVQAASWVDVTEVEIVVDGATLDRVPVLPGDADPAHPATRWQGTIPVPVRPSGSYVIVAARGERALEPVHSGRIPFGVANPIFLRR